MLTALTIENRTYNGFSKRLVSLFSANSIKVQNYTTPCCVRCIKYINRRGKINWKKISRVAQQGRVNLLYSQDEAVPADLGIKVFEPLELRQRLCSNMALAVLEIMKDVPKELRIGLYDPKGEFSDLTEHILRYTQNLIVVTKNYAEYSRQAELLLSEMGAVLIASPHISMLSTCTLIIAPTLIDKSFTPMTKAVILTCHEPALPLACRVYYRYSFRLEERFEKLRPEGLEAEVFAGGLYSLCSVYTLGSLIPLVCTSNSDTQTTLSLRRYLDECFNT